MRSLLKFAMTIAATALLTSPINVLAQSWSSLSSMNNVRFEASAVQYKDDIFVFNGFKQGGIEPSVELFDAGTKQWSVIANTSVAQGTAVTHNGLVRVGNEAWLIGGRIGSHPGMVTSNVWIFNLDSKTWRTGPQLPIPGAAGGAALVNNKIHWFGGLDVNANCDVTNHFVYDLNVQSAGWQNITGVAAMPSPRNHFSTAVHNGIIYAIGGQLGHDNCPGKGGIDVNLVHAFNPATNQWSAKSSLPANQSHAEGSTFVYQNAIYMIGGKLNGNKVFRFDPQNNDWNTVMNLPNALLAPVARVIDNQLIVSSGGSPNYLSPTNLTLSTDAQPLLLPGSVVTEPVVISLEAEYFDTNDSSATHQWVSNILSGASNDASMVTTPDSGDFLTTSANSPSLGYYAYFNEPGTWYLWVRGWSDANTGVGNIDSLHAGLNGTLSTSADKIDNFPSGWNWSNSTEDGVRASISIPSTGIHMINLWMREDGLSVDKIILTNDPDYQPNGLGPVHFDGADNDIPVPTEPTIWSDSYSVNGQCYCDSSYDHGIATTSVLTNQGSKLVPQICADINAKYGTGPAEGRVYYNTVQCGYEPANNIPDETDCPGISVSTGNYTGPRCQQKGATWNLDLLYPSLEPDDTESPDVLITTPAIANDLLPSNAIFSGTATDSGSSGFGEVRISIRNRSLGQWVTFNGRQGTVASLSATTTNSTNWQFTNNLAAGDYTLYVRALDNAGNLSPWQTRLFSVGVADNQAPTTNFSTPASQNAVLTPGTALSGTASDLGGSGFDEVRISIRDRSQGQWVTFNGSQGTTASLTATTTNSTNWQFTNNLAAGDYTLYVRALDNAGNLSPWQTRLFSVGVADNQAPTTSFSTPASQNAVIAPGTALSGTASDVGGSGFAEVRISIRNRTLGQWVTFNGSQGTTASLSATTANSTNWQLTNNLAVGDYTLYVRALDNAGNLSPWQTRLFSVGVADNQAPTTSFSTPASQAAVLTPGTALSGTASDVGGTGFAEVRISIRNRSLGQWVTFNGSQGTTASLSATTINSTNWQFTNNLAAGDYTLYVRALDNAGNLSPWQTRLFSVQ